ncbi:MAG: flagellar motor switch protein FliM [Candidatus Latescibacteria bacterium]|nr:flagellar motor switch protein FliM [Candidatus Latescibacterota bacterium]
MGDILSQGEADALLAKGAAMEDKKLSAILKGKGIAGEEVANFLRGLVALRSGELPPEERQVRALEALDRLLVGIAQSKKKLADLRARVQNFVAPQKQEPMKQEPMKQEKIDQLLSVAEGSDDAGRGGGGSFEGVASQQIATAYDFKHPARVNMDQLRTLESLHDNFARLLGSTFSGAMRAVVDVDTAFVDQTTYAEFIMSLSNPSCSYQFTLGQTHGQAILDVALPLVFSFVDRIFGGKGSSQGVSGRQLTAIEMGVINKIIKRVIEDLEATWEPILRVEISDVELETNPEFMQITAASEIVILLAFEVNSTNASGLVSLCYPFFTLESILPRLGQQSYARQTRANKDELLRSNRLRLGPVKVPLRVELGRGTLDLAEAETLQVGDVICAQNRKTDPCVIFVQDEPKFYARPFATETGEISLQVVGKVPRTMEMNYKTAVGLPMP